MFGVDTTELLIVALAALIFIGPKELPGAMRTVGRWVGQARAHARHFTSGIETMMREAELEEMEKRWREENERIMRDHPVALPYVGAGDTVGGAVPGQTDAATGLATGELASDALPPGTDPAALLAPIEAEGQSGLPQVVDNDDEPSLPLPKPDHHRRELP